MKFILDKLPNKEYAAAKTTALEVIYTVTNNFGSKLKKQVPDILQFALKIINFCNLSYNEYCKTFDIIQVIAAMEGVENNIQEIYQKLYNQIHRLNMSQRGDIYFLL